MKVLVTGGYGFIGSHVVETFYREGYEVFIIDNLSSGSPKNVSCRHKAYKFDVEDKRCDEIFRNNKFDVVIHLAAQIDVAYSIENPFYDAKSNILGLINMLELSVKYKVKRFISASSAAVYGNNPNIPFKEESKCSPLSPYGISNLTGEQYCLKWNDIYNLETVCLRFSNVYGPRQGLIGEGGVISKYMGNLVKELELTVYGHGDQTGDFIYVSDVAEAILRAAESYVTGIYNVSTNTEHSINELVFELNRLKRVKDIIYQDARKGDIIHSRLDNTKVRKALDWTPKYQLDEGIRLTYDWYSKNYTKRKADIDISENGHFTSFIKKSLPYIENIIFFIIVLFLYRFLNTDSYFNIIDPSLVYIILMGAAYGTKHSIISGILSGLLYTFISVSSGRDLFSLILDTGYISHISSYILVGMAVGYIVNKQNRQASSDKIKNEALKEKYEFLEQMYNETYLVKSELQKQILNYEDSYGKVYQIIKSLDSLNIKHLYKSAINVLERILNADEICIYTINPSQTYLDLAAKSHKEDFDPDKVIVFEYFNHFINIKNQLLKGQIFVNKDLIRGLPLLVAPILYEDRLKEVIAIYNIDFESLTLSYINLFKTVSKLINISFVKAYTFEKFTVPKKYVISTAVARSSLSNIISKNPKHTGLPVSNNREQVHLVLPVLSGEEAIEIEALERPENNPIK